VRTAAARAPVFLQNDQSFEQPGKPVFRPVALHSHRQRLPLTDEHDQLLAPGHARVNEVALQKQALLHARGRDGRREFRRAELGCSPSAFRAVTGPPSHAESQPRKTKRQ